MIGDRSVKLFQKAAREIPAYQAFLKQHDFDSGSVQTSSDFATVPVTSKKNYLIKNSVNDMLWPENLGLPMLYCATSGSTGEPYYFPRNDELSKQYSYILEDFLVNGKDPQKNRTLVIIGFGMGVWIGGVITLRAFEIAGERMKVPVSLLPTGYNQAEIFKALTKLSPQYDQTIIVGYPPFVKEIVDEAPHHDIDLKKLNIRFLFAAESFTEKFRDYLCKKAGIKNPVLDTMNIYGTADIGAMAYETPLSILVRRLASKKPGLFKELFGQIDKTPTLAQFNPKFIEFEEVEHEVLLTGNAVLPLIRYAVGDNGGVRTFSQISKALKSQGINLEKEAKKAGITGKLEELPFVFVYERKDFSVTLHGINIFPEFIKEGLLDEALHPYLTERFTMITKNDRHYNQYLEINVELQKNIKASRKLNALTHRVLKNTLIEKSSEFAEISKSRSSTKLVRVVIWPNGYPRYFPVGVKQKWVQTEETLVQ